MDLFQPVFKQYKKRHPPPDLSNVIDFKNAKQSSEISKRVNLKDPVLPRLVGLRPAAEWEVYTLTEHPGLYVILNPFESGFECYWVSRCLDKYPQKPNITNLDAHMERTEDTSIWRDFAKLKRTNLTKDDLLMKLRWATLGYHYDWNTKKYYSDRFTPFPSDLSFLATYIAAALGYPQFSAEAGIVNYYHEDSTLAGHTDHSEFDHSAPLISLSFGQDAIFLIGGETKETEPSALFLRHGDICVMSGASRIAYHAVPKIIPTVTRHLPVELDGSREFFRNLTEQKCCITPQVHHDCLSSDKACLNLCADVSVDEINIHIMEALMRLEWTPFDTFLKSSRINVNIRQVFKPGQSFPDES